MRVFDRQDLQDMQDLDAAADDEADMMDQQEDKEEGEAVTEYKSDDELEDIMSRVESHSIYTSGSQIEAMIVKFNVHKQKRELLEQDLNNKNIKKPKKGINTYFFGDNR